MHSFYKVLGCEHRIDILEALLEEEDYTCICEMEDVIDRDRSVVYRHFRKLESAGLIETRRNGRRVEARIIDKNKIERLFEITEEMMDEVE